MAIISNFLKIFKKEAAESSAGTAKERLKIIIASSKNDSDFSFVPKLEKEILELIKKYVEIEENDVDMKVEVDDDTGFKMLELNVNLPEGNKINLKT